MKLALVVLFCAASAFAQNDFQQSQNGSNGGSNGAFGGGSNGAFNGGGNSWRSDDQETQNNSGFRGGALSAPNVAQPAQSNSSGGSSKRDRKPVKKDDDGNGQNDGAGGLNGAGDDGDQSGGGESAAPVDLAGARDNFAALAESYVAQRSPKGYWNYVSRKGAKARRLVEPQVDEKTVRRVRGERFAAMVTLRDAASRKPVLLEFEADFTGTNWKIDAVRPAALSSRR